MSGFGTCSRVFWFRGYTPVPCCAHVPHIFRGASSSSSIGWLRKISLDFRHSPLISVSVSCTFLPGFEPRTETNRTRKMQYNFLWKHLYWALAWLAIRSCFISNPISAVWPKMRRASTNGIYRCFRELAKTTMKVPNKVGKGIWLGQ